MIISINNKDESKILANNINVRIGSDFHSIIEHAKSNFLLGVKSNIVENMLIEAIKLAKMENLTTDEILIRIKENISY